MDRLAGRGVEGRPNRNKSSDWIRDFNTPRIVTKPAPNAKGARPLADIARWKVVKEFRNLTSEHFATVPWTVAEKIWDQIVAMYGPACTITAREHN